ncbi:MAG: helix-turn-helix transcriptional regulator [Rhodocyclales bacterium]|nr:helix-turn-helix transcriptional regulator [Rhodocyclales bacterium]
MAVLRAKTVAPPVAPDDGRFDIAVFGPLIKSIYQGPLDNPPWASALARLRELLHARHVTLVLRQARVAQPSLTITAGANGVTVDATIYSRYEVFTLDPFVGADGIECRFRVTRGPDPDPFTDSDRKFCEALLPHFELAVHIHSKLCQVESERKVYATTVDRMLIGTIILDEEGVVLSVSGTAQQTLDETDGIRKMPNGSIRAEYASENRELQRVIKKAAVDAVSEVPSVAEVVSITRPSGRPKLGLLIRTIPQAEMTESRHQPTVALFVRDSERKSETPQEVFQQLFGLTPAEASLALQLANGLTLDEAADEVSIRKNTARAHLRSIFSKTGVTRQTTLVRMLLSSVASMI